MNVTDVITKDWTISINEQGGIVQDINDIDQCIGLILTTVKGSDPLRPEFGTNIFRYIDKPINQVKPRIVREVYEALAIYEPRAKVNKVLCTFEDGHIQTEIFWSDKRNNKEKVTVIPYGN